MIFSSVESKQKKKKKEMFREGKNLEAFIKDTKKENENVNKATKLKGEIKQLCFFRFKWQKNRRGP